MRKNEARNLNKKEGDPAFFIKGISFNDDIPFEYCITINPADRYVLSSKMKPE